MQRRFPRLLLALAALAAPTAPARAGHPAAYRGQFDFTTVSVTPLSDTEVLVIGLLAGTETHLGRFTGEVRYVVDLADFTFEGTLTKVAANGDRLSETLTGQFTPTGSVGEFTITGGTGRFQDATGGGEFVGVWTDPDLITAHITF